MRLPEPGAEHAVFGNAVQHAVRAHDGRIHRARQDQGAHDDNEPVEYQAREKWSFQVHRQPADQVFEEVLADVVRNDHHGEEGNQGGKNQAVDKNDRAGLFQVGELRAFDFAIDLSKRFLAAHRQDGVAEGDEDGNDSKHVRKAAVREPAEGAAAQPEVARIRPRRQRGMAHRHCVGAPGDEHHYHHGDQLHDMQSFFAGLGNALGVLPPEIKRDDNGKARGDETGCSGRERATHVKILQKVFDQSREVLACSDSADWSREDVIKHQRGNAEFRERPAEGHFHGAIHAAAHEHAAAFHVNGAHGVRKQHDGEDEPRRSLADVAFGFAAGIVRRGGQVVQHDGRRPPERNECQEGGSGDDDTRNTVAAAASGSRAMGSAAHVWVSLNRRLKCSHF